MLCAGGPRFSRPVFLLGRLCGQQFLDNDLSGKHRIKRQQNAAHAALCILPRIYISPRCLLNDGKGQVTATLDTRFRPAQAARTLVAQQI